MGRTCGSDGAVTVKESGKEGEEQGKTEWRKGNKKEQKGRNNDKKKMMVVGDEGRPEFVGRLL